MRRLSAYDKALADGGMTTMSGTPAVISAGLYFDKLPTSDAVEKVVRDGFLSFDALNARPVDGRWVPCAAFDIKKHVFQVEVADEAAILAFVSSMLAKPLQNKDEGPWWEIHCIASRDTSSREMIFFRVEHACADGMALLQVLNRCSTSLEGTPLPPAVYTRPRPPKPSLGHLACSALAATCKYLNLPLGAFDSVSPFHPSKPCELLTFGERKLVVVPPHSLNVIKRIKTAIGHGTTVNDVVYAAFAGAVRRYCERQGSDTNRANLRALVPFAFARDASSPLTNDWTFLSTEMPVHEGDALARVHHTHKLFSALKASPEALIARALVVANSTLPPCLFGFVGRSLMSRHSLVFSNVPGPSQQVAIGGQPVVGLLPAFANLIPQVRRPPPAPLARISPEP